MDGPAVCWSKPPGATGLGDAAALGMNEEICWRLRFGSFRAASRARHRSRIASCRTSGTQTAVSSPARDSLARLTASRRFVFTRSPGFFGMSEGAATKHSCPRLLISRWRPYPVGPASSRNTQIGF